MRKRLSLILVLFLFALLFVYAGVNSYFFAKNLNSGFPGWYVGRDGRVLLTRFGSNDAANALQDGDVILDLDGQPFTNSSQYFETFKEIGPGSNYTISINRGGQRRNFALQTTSLPQSLFLLKLVTEARVLTFIWLSMALGIFLLQPENKQAVLLAVLLASGAVGGEFSPNLILAHLPALLMAVMISVQVISMLSIPVLVHFFLVFPERAALLRRFPRMEYLIYLPWWLVGIPYVWLRSYLWITAPARFLELPKQFPLITQSANSLLLVYLVVALAIFVVSYHQANQASRRKIRVVVAGSISGLVPFFFTKAVEYYWGNFVINNLFAVASIIAALMLALLPLSFAYAIARHQVVPLKLIVRRTVQYLLAKNGLRILLALPVIGIVLTVAAHPERPIGEVLFRNSIYFYALITLAVALGLLYRKRVSEWIDRKFFREAYNDEKILRELIDDVKRLDSIPEMSRRVSQQVESALHPSQVHLFYREEERRDLSLGYSSDGVQTELRIPEESQLLRLVENQSSAVDFSFVQESNLPPAEKDWLSQLGTNLIVPIIGTDSRVSGLFLLGHKKSEVPYTAEDRRLLETLADQIAIVYENVRLKDRVDKDRKIQQEVLARVEKQKFNLLKECPQCGACYESSRQVCDKDQTELTLSLPVERTIENRYRLGQLIGKGGMGAVYAATDLRLNRQVAVKILMGSMFGDRAALRRFEREARTSARLSHPNIVTVHDYGLLRSEGAFLVMELAPGETLRAKLQRERRLSPKLAAEMFNQVLEGLKAAHAAGVVHRDLKPANLLISESDDGGLQARILDFGLAKLTQAIATDSQSPTAAAPLTTPGMAVGTFGYMSPEQLMGSVVDERSDLFAIGVMVVEALTGKRPFSGASYHEVLTNSLHNPFHLADGSPEARQLDCVLQKCLAKDPAARFSSAAKLQEELIDAIRNMSPLAVRQLAEPEAETAIR